MPDHNCAMLPIYIISRTSMVYRVQVCTIMRTPTHSNFERQKKAKTFSMDARGFINMGTITGILTTVVVGIVILLIVAALAPTFITAVADLVNAVENTSFNNTTADSLRSVFGLLIALGGLFAIVAFAFLAYRRRSR